MILPANNEDWPDSGDTHKERVEERKRARCGVRLTLNPQAVAMFGYEAVKQSALDEIALQIGVVLRQRGVDVRQN